MTELKSNIVVEPEITVPLTKVRRMPKMWIIAKEAKAAKCYKHENGVVELLYTQILEHAKALFSTLPDASSRTVFERDYRYDNSETSLGMHSFVTPTFYWHLECHLAFYYQVEYDFHNCPFEDEVRALFERKFSFNMQRCNQRHLKPNCTDYHEKVLQFQDQQYITIL